jgi:hypothetical protein
MPEIEDAPTRSPEEIAPSRGLPSAADLYRESASSKTATKDVDSSTRSAQPVFSSGTASLRGESALPNMTITGAASTEPTKLVSGAEKDALARRIGFDYSDIPVGVRASRESAKPGESRTPAVDVSKLIPNTMKYGAAANPWNRLTPDESTALTKSLKALTTDLPSRKAATVEKTASGATVSRDHQGRVMTMDDPSTKRRIHIAYEGKSKEASAVVVEKTNTGHKIAMASVDASGKGIASGEWISVNSAGEKRQWKGAAATSDTGKFSMKFQRMNEPSLIPKSDGPDRPKRPEAGDKRKDKADAKPDAELTSARDMLKRTASRYITNPADRAEYLRDMSKFEDSARKAGHSAKEVASFYKESERMLRGPSTHVKEQDRVRLAMEGLKQAIDPTRIDQGRHNTCNVTTVEVNMYTRNPSKAMKAITDAALTGKFKSADGSVITLPDKALQPLPKGGDGSRTFASQLFQNLAVNVRWQRSTLTPSGEPCAKGDLRYCHDMAKPDKKDSGQRIYRDSDGSAIVNKKGVPFASPRLGIADLTDIYKQIAGKVPETLGIREGNPSAHSAEGIKNISSEKQLHDELTRLSSVKGGLPVILRIHTGHEPWYKDSGAGKAGGSGGWHVVTITGYDAATKKVSVDNTWGKGVDHSGLTGQAPKIALADVYKSMFQAPPRPKIALPTRK